MKEDNSRIPESPSRWTLTKPRIYLALPPQGIPCTPKASPDEDVHLFPLFFISLLSPPLLSPQRLLIHPPQRVRYDYDVF